MQRGSGAVPGDDGINEERVKRPPVVQRGPRWSAAGLLFLLFLPGGCRRARVACLVPARKEACAHSFSAQ